MPPGGKEEERIHGRFFWTSNGMEGRGGADVVFRPGDGRKRERKLSISVRVLKKVRQALSLSTTKKKRRFRMHDPHLMLVDGGGREGSSDAEKAEKRRKATSPLILSSSALERRKKEKIKEEDINQVGRWEG